jgi:hypothetical protein
MVLNPKDVFPVIELTNSEQTLYECYGITCALDIDTNETIEVLLIVVDTSCDRTGVDEAVSSPTLVDVLEVFFFSFSH